MSEEKIIKRLKNIIEINKSFLNCDIQKGSNIYKDIQGLLDLYNREKEKNDELENKIDELISEQGEREKYTHSLEDLYNKEKKKNKEAINMLEKHIEHCEGEANGSLHNEICHIALKFDKHLLNVLKKE